MVAVMSKMERVCFVLQPPAVRRSKAMIRSWYVHTVYMCDLA